MNAVAIDVAALTVLAALITCRTMSQWRTRLRELMARALARRHVGGTQRDGDARKNQGIDEKQSGDVWNATGEC